MTLGKVGRRFLSQTDGIVRQVALMDIKSLLKYCHQKSKSNCQSVLLEAMASVKLQ